MQIARLYESQCAFAHIINESKHADWFLNQLEIFRVEQIEIQHRHVSSTELGVKPWRDEQQMERKAKR